MLKDDGCLKAREYIIKVFIAPLLYVLRSRAKAAIGFSYTEGEEDDSEGEGKTDEDILTAFLAEQEPEKEKAFSSESEYGEEGVTTHTHLPSFLLPKRPRDPRKGGARKLPHP